MAPSPNEAMSRSFSSLVLLPFLCSGSHYNPITHPDKVESLLKNVYRPANTLITNVQICLMFWILGEFYVNMHERIQHFTGKAPTYYSAKLFLKLHENKGNWNESGGARPKFYYVDPLLLCFNRLQYVR